MRFVALLLSLLLSLTMFSSPLAEPGIINAAGLGKSSNQLPDVGGNERLPSQPVFTFKESTGAAGLTESQTQADICSHPANPVVAENCKSGTEDWRTQNNLNDIDVFANPISANLGESVNFFVDTNASSYSLTIFRSGYYGGKGARLITSVSNLKGQNQPGCQRQADTGLVSCSNWTATYRLSLPSDWVSGVYIARLVRSDTGGTAYAMFVVRDDGRKSDILYQQSAFTYQAYNRYKGPSV